jgi:hypothetical protein
MNIFKKMWIRMNCSHLWKEIRISTEISSFINEITGESYKLRQWVVKTYCVKCDKSFLTTYETLYEEPKRPR